MPIILLGLKVTQPFKWLPTTISMINWGQVQITEAG